MHTQFINLHVGLGLELIFLCFFRFTIYVLDQFILVLLASVVFSFFSIKLNEWLGRMNPKLYILCQVGFKILTQSISYATYKMIFSHLWQSQNHTLKCILTV